MSSAQTQRSERRAQRLVRLYPGAWRERYGEEFVQFLVDDMTERPWAPGRSWDVLHSALGARLAAHGLLGSDAAGDRRLRAGLALCGLALVSFSTLALAVWSQLTVSWQWAAPSGAGTRAGMYLMTVAMLLLSVLSIVAVAPLLWVMGRRLLGGDLGRVIGPLGVASLAAAGLVLGGMHFAHGWPGTGAHAWPGRRSVPGAVAGFGWAATLWVSSYWAHPGALSAFPAAEVGWMIASPVALLALAGAVGVALSRVELPPAVLSLEARLMPLFGAAMVAFLAGATSWIGADDPAPHGLFRTGVLDVVVLVAMGVALAAVWHVARRHLGATRRLSIAG